MKLKIYTKFSKVMTESTKIWSLIFILICSIFYSQSLKIEIEQEEIDFGGDTIEINYIIKNDNSFPIFLILNPDEFSIYDRADYYFLENPKVKFEYHKDEKIFNPRTIISDIDKKDTLDIMPTLSVTPDITYLDECQQKENKIIESEKKNVIEFQKGNFPKKDLVWNKRAKYINENFIIIYPSQEKKLSTKVNFEALVNNPKDCNLYNVGYKLNNDEYYFSIKIHSDSKLALKYLTKENKKIIKESKAIGLNKDYYSQSVILK